MAGQEPARVVESPVKKLFRTLPSLFLCLLVSTAPSANTLIAPELEDIAFVLRDTDGIAHLFARSEHDVFYLQGWVHAQDRLFQMDVSRRRASGTLAELLGVEALADDVELRAAGLRRSAERSLAMLSTSSVRILEAYADGVNAYVAGHALPPEYAVLELSTFSPWTSLDSVAIGNLLNLSTLTSGLEDIKFTQALRAYQAAGARLGFDGEALFSQDLFRSAPFDPASTVPDAKLQPRARRSGKQRPSTRSPAPRIELAPETMALARQYLDRVRDLESFQGAFGQDNQGSNAWVVDGDHTERRSPLLANDPHRTLGAPSNLYPIHLRIIDGKLDAIGQGGAGMPFVFVGQNQHMTWGATRNPADATDVFQERIVADPDSPSGMSTRYLGALEPVIPLPQQFRYNKLGDGTLDSFGVAPPDQTTAGTFVPGAVLIVPRRNNGPILSFNLAAGFALSVQSTLFSGTRQIDALRGINLAQSLFEFAIALHFFDGSSRNWMYADRRGNIAHFTDAEIPVREDLQAGTVSGLPPYFIRRGGGGNEWLPVRNPQPGQALPFEVLPFKEMPKVVNPAAGFIINANNDPAGLTLDNDPINQLRPGGGIYYLNPGYAAGFRAGRITQLLEGEIAKGPVTLETMQAVQADVVMLDAMVLTPYIVAAFDAARTSSQPELRALAGDTGIIEAAGRLARWDFSTPTGIPEGYDASDINGTLLPPDEAEIAASVAATIYSMWRSQLIRNTIDAVLDPLGLPGPDGRESVKALRNLLDNFDTQAGIGASGINFFDVPGVDDPPTRRDLIILQSLRQALDLLASSALDDAFGGSMNQDDYRWGRLHRLEMPHPLGTPFSIPPAQGAFPPPLADLSGIPIDGGFNVIDQSSHDVRFDANADNPSDEFMVSDLIGPTNRYVSSPGVANGQHEARNSLPGGVSGIATSPYYLNLLGAWLTNDDYPVRQSPEAILRDIATWDAFIPADP
jgi:penicillin amidase